MKILTENSGKNKHGQALARVQCSCGNIFEPIFNNVKSGRTKTCGHCNKPDKITVQETEKKSTTDPVSELEYGSVAWIAAHIESKKAAARSAEIRVKELQDLLAECSSTNLDLLKKWTAESTAFEKLNHQIAALQLQKDKRETCEKKDTRTQAEIMRDKIAYLEGLK